MKNLEAGNILSKVERRENFSFSKNTTYGCGGNAKAAFFPCTQQEAAAVFKALSDSGERFYVLGAGSNILAQDGYFDGYIISTAKLKNIKCESDLVLCDSGVKISELLAFCKRRSLGGLEYLAGIPASIGGAAYMNAGAAGIYIQQNVQSVSIYDGELRNFTYDECKFSYKHSTMCDINSIILSVNLVVTHSTASEIEEKMRLYLARRENLPKGKSCGCVFKNYSGVSAGKIIEGAGLKGVRMGGAVVSREHGNFIINNGGSSSDVYSLIKFVKDEVYKKLGITLQEEVCYFGDFK